MNDLKATGCTWPGGVHSHTDGRCTVCGHVQYTAEQMAEAESWVADCMGLTGGMRPTSQVAMTYVKANYPGGWEAFVRECCTAVTVTPEAPELKRYDVVFTKAGEADFRTYTWGATRDDAYNRATEFKAKYADAFAGWAFDVAQEPTLTLPDVMRAHDGHTVRVGGSHSVDVHTVDARADDQTLVRKYGVYSVECYTCDRNLSQQWA